MKQIFKVIVAILFVAVAVNSYAAKNEDITLIVTSDGATKDEAIKNALRNAIEQTYGVFVSANTDILNDEVVSDEIATIASGNIKSYKELSSSQSNGKTIVTLEAVVSIGKLISYAKSKGAEVEFDGASMYADIELQELYMQNEELAVDNLLRELTELFKKGYDYELKIEKDSKKMPMWDLDYKSDENSIQLVCFIIAKLNPVGEKAWVKLYDFLENIGKKYNDPNSMRSLFKNSAPDDVFQAMVTILKGSKLYNGTDYPRDYFLLRSYKSAEMINGFIYKIPKMIENISIVTDGEKNDISNKIGYQNTYAAGDPEFYREKDTLPYKKKKGNTCSKLVYKLSFPKEKLKYIKSVKVEHN